jgi:hypothetical protein
MVSCFPVHSRDVTNQTLPGRGIIKLFPARESLVSDIPARNGKTANHFLQCNISLFIQFPRADNNTEPYSDNSETFL